MLVYMSLNEVEVVAGLTTMIVTLLARRAAAAALTSANVSGNGSPLVMMTAMRWVPALSAWYASHGTMSLAAVSMPAVRLKKPPLCGTVMMSPRSVA